MCRPVENQNVSRSTATKRLCANLKRAIERKAVVHSLWIVGCSLHPFLQEFQFVPSPETMTVTNLQHMK